MNNYAFIDAQNLYLSLFREGIRLDYLLFRRYLSDKYQISKVFYFIGYKKGNVDMYKSLENFGYTLIFKKTTGHGANMKGNCDSDLIMQVVREWKNFDKAIVISGDGDFLPLLKYLFEHQKLLKIGIPTMKSRSSLLKPFREQSFFIDRLKEKLSS